MGQRHSRYATDDEDLRTLLKSVMGNPSAANLYWSCMMSDRLSPFQIPDDTENRVSCKTGHDELGGLLNLDAMHKLDKFCSATNISRFVPVLVSFSVLMQHYGNSTEFYIHHNYGMTGTAHRKLKYPFTKVKLSDDASTSFENVCLVQNSMIQHSSYHLCIPNLPEDGNEESIDQFLGVFLIDNTTGHTRDLITSALQDSSLSLILELLDDHSIVIRIHYNLSVVSPILADSIYHQFVHTLTFALDNPATDVRAIPTVPSDQELSILSTFNNSENMQIFPDLNTPLHNLIMERATQSPDAIALHELSPTGTITSSLTYAELVSAAFRLSNRICPQLSRKPGLSTPNVAILLNRGMNQIIAILATLMAGCAYVPIDPINHPPERIDYILRDSGAECLITNPSEVGAAKYFLSKISVIDINHSGDLTSPSPPIISPPVPTSDLIAYVIYTSGSTGNPKGVAVPHLGIVNDVFCVFKKFLKSDKSILSNVVFSTNICFDAHVDELYLPLIFGGTISCLTRNIAEYESLPNDVSFIQATPSVFQVISIPGSVKCVLIGGEKLTQRCLEKVMTKSDRIVINGYGPTETTNESSLHVVKSTTDTNSIGTPIWNTQFYILDKFLGQHLVPKGAWGELYIGGLGVTKGYVNQPELTASVFRNSISCLHFPRDEIVYKTGDLVRINSETNELEFKGRISFDQQVKLRGYRIELGEISSVMISTNQGLVSDCHVMIIDEQIIAFVVSEKTTIQLQFGHLPEYMKPSRVVFVKELPRNIAGKLDARRLSALAKSADSGFVDPSCDSVEKSVIEGFQTAVPTASNISSGSNFFSIGGNSLNLLLLRNHLADRFPDIEFRLQTLLQLQTVDAISKFIRDEKGETKTSIQQLSSVIIPLGKQTVNGQNFYCVHAAGGQVHTYTYLSDMLATHGVNVLGIQDPSLTTNSSLLYRRLSSFEAMGEFYASLIHKTHPSESQIFIGGHSSGGAIGFEVAKNLISLGRKVECVFLLDTDLDQQADDQEETDQSGLINVIERMDEIRSYLYNGWKEGLMHDYVQSAARRAADSSDDTFFTRLMKKTESTSNVWSLIQSVLPKTSSTENSSTSDLVQMISLLDHHLQLEKKYVAKGECDFDLIQFTPRTSLEEAPTAPSTPKSSWAELTTRKWTQVFVPDANHYNIIRPPAVGILATVIADRMGTKLTSSI